MTAAQMLLCDTREPNPHPWAKYLPEGWALERGTLETGDLALAALPEGAVIERKTSSDMAGCIGRDRERFTRELRRGRYVGRLVVVVEGTMSDVAAGRPRHSSQRRCGHARRVDAALLPIRFLRFRATGGRFRFQVSGRPTPRDRGLSQCASVSTQEQPKRKGQDARRRAGPRGRLQPLLESP